MKLKKGDQVLFLVEVRQDDDGEYYLQDLAMEEIGRWHDSLEELNQEVETVIKKGLGAYVTKELIIANREKERAQLYEKLAKIEAEINELKENEE